MKSSIKKLLSVGVKLHVVSFEREIFGRYRIEDKADILKNIEKYDTIKNFRIVSENLEFFEVAYTSNKVPEKLDCIRAIDIVQTNAIRFDSGSWLYYGPAAQSELTKKGFKVWEIDCDGKICDVIEYEFCE